MERGVKEGCVGSVSSEECGALTLLTALVTEGRSPIKVVASLSHFLLLRNATAFNLLKTRACFAPVGDKYTFWKCTAGVKIVKAAPNYDAFFLWAIIICE